MTFDWTPDAEALLRRRAAEGATAREVAGELGVTRSAVLGKAHRDGIEWRRARATVLDRGGVKSPIRAGIRVEVALLDDVLATRPESGVPLWELRRASCRWPLRSGAPWAFCGEPAVDKKSYCAEHAARVYVPFKRGEK